jgi:hypothetical protein
VENEAGEAYDPHQSVTPQKQDGNGWKKKSRPGFRIRALMTSVTYLLFVWVFITMAQASITLLLLP